MQLTEATRKITRVRKPLINAAGGSQQNRNIN